MANPRRRYRVAYVPAHRRRVAETAEHGDAAGPAQDTGRVVYGVVVQQGQRILQAVADILKHLGRYNRAAIAAADVVKLFIFCRRHAGNEVQLQFLQAAEPQLFTKTRYCNFRAFRSVGNVGNSLLHDLFRRSDDIIGNTAL